MPRVLLFGATGYLGSAIARVLVLSGNHTVYGLSRSASKAPQLAALEVMPIVCAEPAKDAAPYLDAIKKHRIDCVIDATAAYGDSLSFLQHIAGAAKEAQTKDTADGVPPPKLGYIYISGLWVHGSSPLSVTDRIGAGLNSSPTPAMDIANWRPGLERATLAMKDVLDVCIIRPAQMYGYGSNAWGAVLGPIAEALQGSKGEVKLPIPEDALIASCHVDDVADAVRLAVEHIENVGSGGAQSGVYPLFDIIAFNESLQSLLQGFADELGKRGAVKVHLTGPADDLYLAALSSTVKASNARAKQYLGWAPKRGAMSAGMDVYAKAWAAANGMMK